MIINTKFNVGDYVYIINEPNKTFRIVSISIEAAGPVYCSSYSGTYYYEKEQDLALLKPVTS